MHAGCKLDTTNGKTKLKAYIYSIAKLDPKLITKILCRITSIEVE